MSVASQGNLTPDQAPISLLRFGHFFVGGRIEETISGRPMVGQMYVEYYLPASPTRCFPLIMIHGGFQTGTNFTGTPDGREGWAQFFLRRGYAVYVVDQVARGRSPHWSGALGKVDDSARWNSQVLERRFTATGKHSMWPQATLQTQFPGSGEADDPVFRQFYASQFPALADFERQQELNRDAIVALIDKIGPSILLTHSQSGAYGWAVADARSNLVKGIVALEPNGPPVHNIIDGQQLPDWYKDAPEIKKFGLTHVPLAYDPPVTEDRPLKFRREDHAAGPGLVRGWKQAEPAAKLVRLAGIPVGIFVSEASYHAQYDHCTSNYLKQAGVKNDLIKLAQHGISGNGHMMMIEKNSDEVAELVHRWITQNIG